MGRKRKNRNSTDNGCGNSKRQKLDKSVDAVAPPNGGKRKRKRTKQLREDLKTEIEKALRKEVSPIRHLFTIIDKDEGFPCAPFWKVIEQLPVDIAKVREVSETALMKMNNITSMFCVYKEEKTEEGKSELMMGFYPVGASIGECTVYIDNLPICCDEAKLNKLLKQFGTVVELRLPRSKSQKVVLASGEAEVGRGRKRFAFVQFTEAESAEKLMKAYENNAPKKGKRPPHLMAITQLIQSIRKYKVKGDRMSAEEIIALRILRRRMRVLHRKEYAARRLLRRRRYRHLVATGIIRPRQHRRRPGKKSCQKRRSIEAGMPKNPNFKSPIKKKSTTKKPPNDDPPVPQNKEPKEPVIKKRRRRRRKRYLKPGYIKGSIKDYFALIQVIPFAKYRELREEYINRRDTARREQQRHFRNSLMAANGGQMNAATPVEYHESKWVVSECNDCSDASSE